VSQEQEGTIAQIAKKLADRRDDYHSSVVEGLPFQDALRRMKGISSDFIRALNYAALQGTRFSAQDDFLIFRFAPSFVESVLSIQLLAHEGLQNAARRELRFILEAAVKLSAQDYCKKAKDFEARLAGLSARDKKFEVYAKGLTYFSSFENPQEANTEVQSLYAELSGFVHASEPQFRAALNRNRKSETIGMETVATLNRFNDLFFQVLDIVLVRIYHGFGLSLAGDTFIQCFDSESKWRFHKGKYTKRMSRCFDYKAERQHSV
jgi:hypothetical protein